MLIAFKNQYNDQYIIYYKGIFSWFLLKDSDYSYFKGNTF